ncbi:hypothetical protein [Natrialba chahannaoensis]|uniref:hypothetical protein n=1 Tax=Natrialba chahannaoensis TaxID=68911 RepID=UPI000A4C6232|nr:hypothetical protein [Natrialba chahannaoensis]
MTANDYNRPQSTAIGRDIHTPRAIVSTMDKNQFIALGFAFLMVTSMIAWGALAAF